MEVQREPADSEWQLRSQYEQETDKRQDAAHNNEQPAYLLHNNYLNPLPLGEGRVRAEDSLKFLRPSPGRLLAAALSQRERVSNNFQLIKEIADLECGGLRPIRAVNRIPLNVSPELFPDGAGIGFGRIGRAHDFAEFVDRVIRFKHH